MMTNGDGNRDGNQGPAVDRHGDQIVDPTANVRELVLAAIQRQDDLREADQRHTREILELRTQHMGEMHETERSIAELRAGYEEKLSTKESQRIDAIRAVDVDAVARAAEVSAAASSASSTQAIQTAEALRSQVEGTRIATADALAQALAPITKSIEDLRAAQYAQQGERSAAVPISEQLAPLIAEIKMLSTAQSQGAGAQAATQDYGVTRRSLTGMWIAAAAVTSSFLIGAIGIVITLVLARGK